MLLAPDTCARTMGDCFDGLSEKVGEGIKKKGRIKKNRKKTVMPSNGHCADVSIILKRRARCGRDVTQNEIRSFRVVFYLFLFFFYIRTSDG